MHLHGDARGTRAVRCIAPPFPALHYVAGWAVAWSHAKRTRLDLGVRLEDFRCLSMGAFFKFPETGDKSCVISTLVRKKL